jgi:hypothetical protein
MILRAIIAAVVALGVGVMLAISTLSYLSTLRGVGESEQALVETTATICALLMDRHGTNWNQVVQIMNAKHGPEWLNELTPEQWRTLHDLRQELAGQSNSAL